MLRLVRRHSSSALPPFGRLQCVGEEGWQSDSISNDRDLQYSTLAMSPETQKEEQTNHVEALFGVFPGSLSAHTVDSCLLAIVDGRLADALDGRVQVLVELALHRPADVVP